MRVLVLLAMIACGGGVKHHPIVVYRNATDAFELRLSASGALAAMVTFLDYGKYEIRLWARGADERMVGRGPGTIIGVPSEQDVLVIDDDNRVRWLRSARGLALGLPREKWRFVGGSVDHDTHSGTLAFATEEKPPGTLTIVDLDTEKLVVRKQQSIRVANTEYCSGRGRGTTLYVWCLAPDSAPSNQLRWSVTRFDGTATTWSKFLDLPQYSGSDMRGEVTGDGSAFVLLDGLRETSRMRFNAGRVFVLAANDGRISELHTSGSFGFIDDLTPVPGRPAVAYVRWVYSDFDGIVVLDAAAMKMRVAVDRDDKLQPLAMAVLPDGQFLIPGH